MTTLYESLTEVTLLAQEAFRSSFVVFLRVGAAMALLPAFGETSVPQRIRLVLAFAFTAIVFPAVRDRIPQFDGSPMLLLSETAIGLLLGLGLRLFVMALQTAGTIAAQATSLAQLFGGATGEPQPVIGNLLTMAGLALAVAGGLHVRAAELFIMSYDFFPPGQLPDASDVSIWGLHQIARAFTLAFMLAMPFVAASLVFNLALGIINRAMPQLMVTFIGAPALTFGGLVLLLVTAPAALALWLQAMNRFLEAPFVVTP